MKLLRRVRRKPYWLVQTPQEASCGDVLLCWYPQAGKLRIHRQAPGQPPVFLVTLDVDTLALAPRAQEVLGRVLEEASHLRLWA